MESWPQPGYPGKHQWRGLPPSSLPRLLAAFSSSGILIIWGISSSVETSSLPLLPEDAGPLEHLTTRQVASLRVGKWGSKRGHARQKPYSLCNLIPEVISCISGVFIWLEVTRSGPHLRLDYPGHEHQEGRLLESYLGGWLLGCKESASSQEAPLPSFIISTNAWVLTLCQALHKGHEDLWKQIDMSLLSWNLESSGGNRYLRNKTNYHWIKLKKSAIRKRYIL